MKKDYEKIWDNCLEIIKDNVNSQSYKTWFEPIKPIRLQNNVLTIQVPSQFFYEWLEEHYVGLLKKVIRKELGPEGRLEYSIIMENIYGVKPYTVRVPGTNKKEIKNPPVNMRLDMTNSNACNPFAIPGLRRVTVESNLNPEFSFENFIEGDCNRLARSAAFAVTNKPGETSFNPLFIYGGTGLGKTHLAHAIGIEIKKKLPDKMVLYVPAERFTTQFIDAIQNNKTNDFVNFYQMIDVLIVDDVYFLSGKEKTQDVFFHIFNHLQQNKKQIVMTSDRAPVDLVGFEQRLLSRFKWGLAADLQPPDLETRIAILEKMAYAEGIELPRDILEHIAYSITSNIRELRGALISLLAQASLNRKQITIDLARQMIDKFVRNTAKEVSIDYIQKVVCDYFNLPIDLLKSKTRKREVVQARQIAMYFAKQFTKSSLATIGAHCGGKDHATVLHACRTVNNLMDTDKKFRHYIQELDKKISFS